MHSIGETLRPEKNTLKIFGLIEEKFKAVKKLEENIKNRKMIMPLGLV